MAFTTTHCPRSLLFCFLFLAKPDALAPLLLPPRPLPLRRVRMYDFRILAGPMVATNFLLKGG